MTKNIAASIRAKLLAHAKAENADFQRVLVRYAIERLLYRLSLHEAKAKFVLKGAMLFTAWPQAAPRPTGDLDLLGHGAPDPTSMIALFTDICAIADAADGLEFDASKLSAEQLREDEDYQGLRLKLVARLDGAAIPFKIDIGFGDVIYPGPLEIEFPTLLTGMAAPKITAYPPATVVAEKLEAMVRFGITNGRLKDYYDIWTISRTFTFSRAELVESIARTFTRRGTAAPSTTPLGLTDEFTGRDDKRDLWQAFLDRAAPEHRNLGLDDVAHDLRGFLDPVVQQLAAPESAVGAWNPRTGWGA